MDNKNNNPLHDSSAKPGIYFAVLVAEESKKKIQQFCVDIGMDMTNSESPYESRHHATLFCSKETNGKEVKEFKEHVEEESVFKAKPLRWEVFESPNTGKKCLVLKIDSDDLRKKHEEICKSTGLKHAFEDYVPHVSVHYDFKGEIPKELPDVEISLSEMYNKPHYFKSKVENKDSVEIKTKAECAVTAIDEIRKKAFQAEKKPSLAMA